MTNLLLCHLYRTRTDTALGQYPEELEPRRMKHFQEQLFVYGHEISCLSIPVKFMDQMYVADFVKRFSKVQYTDISLKTRLHVICNVIYQIN